MDEKMRLIVGVVVLVGGLLIGLALGSLDFIALWRLLFRIFVLIFVFLFLYLYWTLPAGSESQIKSMRLRLIIYLGLGFTVALTVAAFFIFYEFFYEVLSI